MKKLVATIALLCLSSTALAHDIYSNTVIGLDISAAMDRTVSQCRLKCCQMAVTIYHGLTKLFPPTWQHHHLTIASTIVPIIQ